MHQKSLFVSSPAYDLIGYPQLHQVLHRIFPGVDPLELTLFTASGWHTEKLRWKASFYAARQPLKVADERANLVRSAATNWTAGTCHGPLDIKKIQPVWSCAGEWWHPSNHKWSIH